MSAKHKEETSDYPAPRHDWFSALFGFSEDTSWGYERIQALFELSGTTLRSRVNNKCYAIGRFETPSLGELRARVADDAALRARCGGQLRLSGVVGDVSALQAQHAFATFQAASQFNCLEFVSPSVTPEDGVTMYVCDKTQGPACSVSCGPAAVYRNYFAPVRGSVGQRRTRQLNNLEALSEHVGNSPSGRYFAVKSGYTLADDAGISRLNGIVAAMDEPQRDACRQLLRVGVHQDVQVTSYSWGRVPVTDPGHLITQVFGSACSITYSRNPGSLWQHFATLVLEASYEAALLAALLNYHRNYHRPGANVVFLTLLGGGVFGNEINWITHAIERACHRLADYNLDVRIISYYFVEPEVRQLLDKQPSIPLSTTSADSISTESPIESLPIESLSTESPTDSIPTDSIPIEPLSTESLPTESLSTEPIPIESLATESISTESLPIESLPIESLPTESLPIESLPIESLPTESIPTELLNQLNSH